LLGVLIMAMHQSGSFLTTNTDNDEISMFVQGIDARKPLGRMRTRAVSQGQSPARGEEAYGYEYGYRRMESVDGRMEAGVRGLVLDPVVVVVVVMVPYSQLEKRAAVVVLPLMLRQANRC
jgi:CubicO group peptidase (beta-lactamase class C family)